MKRPSTDGDWRRAFDLIRFATVRDPAARGPGSEERAWYRFRLEDSRATQLLIVEVYRQRRRRVDGEWGRLAPLPLGFPGLEDFSDPEDRQLVDLLGATAPHLGRHMHLSGRRAALAPSNHRSFVPAILHPAVLPRLCATGRFFRSPQAPAVTGGEMTPLRWTEGDPWTFVLGVERRRDGGEDRVRLTGRLRRGEAVCPVTEPRLVIDGAVLFDDTFAGFEGRGQAGGHTGQPGGHTGPPLLHWVWHFRDRSQRDRGQRDAGHIELSVAELDAMLDELWNLPALPPVEMPPEWPLSEVEVAPRPRMVVRSPHLFQAADLEATVSFDYDGIEAAVHDPRSRFVDLPGGRVIERDRDAEDEALGKLVELGAAEGDRAGRFELPMDDFAAIVLDLVAAGWVVEAEGRKLRLPGTARVAVSSGIDWLELRGGFEFDGIELPLPELLLALRRGQRLVRLDDGSVGILPEEWIERYGPLARLGELWESEDGVDAWRFSPSSALLVDALLASESAVDVDRAFARLRQLLKSFDGIEPIAEPRGFVGELRGYQRQGLGWMHFLAGVGFGGCLADDMGLGKTVQVLALLAYRRARPEDSDRRRPSLVVVPRSLVYNWVEEAARFTPGLRVLAYRGPGRSVWLDRLDEHDVVVTTYGTLRRDAEAFSEVLFDYVVLDEAQAIKNAGSQTARACRRLRARHRLALTGTPVENHLGELWSLFAFLNPGMFGRVPALEGILGQADLDGESIAVLAKVLRPLILRRTKETVLSDLPEKTEQVLYCELGERQQRQYDELREHYRARLASRVREVGLEGSKFEVLEALLRLRQAACHPGLVDPAQVGRRSAKLDVLLRQLRVVVAEGHKALVFSQFTGFLALLRRRLDRLGTVYEYLDGKSRQRRKSVERFQSDASCPLFLISLKAGGLGLNLTAADYVFLLDPWWNPAVEAQAVDRAHRIGQTRPVFAYRLIARGTVEEKILELQAKKRRLADAILKADEGLMRTLTADDLRWLLS